MKSFRGDNVIKLETERLRLLPLRILFMRNLENELGEKGVPK